MFQFPLNTRSNLQRSGRVLALAAICIVGQILGCQPTGEPVPAKKPAQQATTITLRVGVVNAPQLASALKLLRGEWSEASRSEFTVVETTLPMAKNQSVDLLVFPSRLMGELCENNQLRSIRSSVWEGKLFNASDLLAGGRDGLATYGQKPMALPLSVDMPLVCLQPELVESIPATWEQYDLTVQQLAQEHSLSPIKSTRHGAWELLARAAPSAWNPQRDGVLFDLRKMTPRITEPPFVRALEDLVDTQRLGTTENSSPITDVYSGKSGIAIGFLPILNGSSLESNANIMWSSCPGVRETYNPTLHEWVTNDQIQRVPVYGWMHTWLGFHPPQAMRPLRFVYWPGSQVLKSADNCCRLRGSCQFGTRT